MGKTNYRIITTHKMANSTYDYKGAPHHKLPALLQSRHIATMQKKQTAFRIKVKQNTATGLYRQPHEGHQTKWSERRIKWYTCIHWRCVTFYVFCLFVCSPPTHPPIFFLSFLSPPPPFSFSFSSSPTERGWGKSMRPAVWIWSSTVECCSATRCAHSVKVETFKS